MVFESIVADLLNKYLGEYVENLDRSQLQIGIWGGDIVLQNLVLKQSALDELDLPVRTVYGVLEKLVLKIPWKNLYRDPVEATVERLYLLAVPNQEVKYDPVKEERWAQDAKQNQLNKVEAAKKWEAEKDLLKQDDSFVEKLSTQIVKNVQVKIGEIHIRYEDRVSSLGRPFALGVTLHNLSVQTTDANWTKAIKDEASKFIFKELNLEGLAVYWNCDTILYSDKPVTEMLQLFKDGIAAKERKPKGYEYLLGPINSSAKLQINQKPEQDGSNYTIPKLQLSLELEKLAICISKSQYRDVMLLLESMDWMTRAAPYRKYRPFVPSYAGHYKEWWHFAFKCILEDEVKRKQRNWNWNFMREHRSLCKSYASAYKQKLTMKKVPAELTIQLQEMENKLDVFNIVLIRQRIEVEVERDQAEEARQKQQRKGWFSSWWGGAAEAEAVQPGSAAELAKKIEAVMTPDEKAKLYRAIDYQENTTPAIYPPHFVENVFSFKLRSLEIEVRDGEDKVRTILSSSLQEVTAQVEQRMSGQALKAIVKISKFDMLGLTQGTLTPQLVSSKLHESDSVLLDVMFEIKPLDESCDQRLRVNARPLRVIYDAATVNSLMDLFKPPETPALQNKIQAAIPVAMPALKEMSVLGLQYAVEQHTVLDVVMDIMPSQILIPQNGIYLGNENLLVINLGRMSVSTASRDTLAMDVRKMHLHGRSEDDILQEMISRSYTKFTFMLEDVQVLLAYAGENWKSIIQERKRSAMHVVMPITLTVNLHKCMVTDDPRLPKMKLCAELGQIDIQLPEDRMLCLINLPNSIPFNDAEPSPLGATDNASHSSQLSLFRAMDVDTARAKGLQLPKLEKPIESQPIMQVIELEAKFVLDMLKVTVYEQKKGSSKDKARDDLDNFDPLITFRLLSLETECVQRTFDTNLYLSIGGIDLKQRYDGADIDAIGTPMTSGQDQYLFTVRFTQVDKKSPELRTTHQSVLKLLQANFSKLNVLIHQEATLQLIAFANHVQSSLDSAVSPQGSRTATAGRKEKNLPTIMEEEGGAPTKSKPVAKRKKKRQVSSTIDLKIVAEMQSVCIQIETKARPLTSMMVQGLVFGAEMRKTQTEISTSIKDFVMLDLNPATLHKKILSIVDEEALSAHVVMYDTSKADDIDAIDMTVKVQMACLHVVFLNWFVSSLLSFLNNFQAAQAAVYEASAAAAAVAKQNAKEAYTKATRMSLDIELKAPIVVVPVNSQSFDALLMDFGRLTIKNSFQNVEVQKQYPAVLDKIQLGLVNVKMSRVRLHKENHEVLNERMLLQPISFTLSVTRNLSSSWYNESPDLDLSGKINSINLSMTQADYRMLMQALSENMSEGSSELPGQSAPDPVETKVLLPTSKTSFSTLPGTQLLPVKDQSSESAKKVHVFMVFRFTMDSLIINLYSGGSNNLEKVPVERPEQGLACFTLYVLALKGQMLSDNSLSTSVRLVDCLLDDTRVGREGKITRLMESKALLPSDMSQTVLSPTSEAAKRTMLDVTVRMKPNDMFVDVRIFSFNLIVSIDYLLKISNFFVGADAKPKSVAQVPSKSTGQSVTSSAPSRTALAVPSSESARDLEKHSQTVMTINLKLEKPDILLVEAMDDLDTNALVLNCELAFNLRQEGEEMKIKGALEELQIFTCCFNKRADTKSPVLQPVRIDVDGSTKPGQGLHMEVISSDIRIAVTPGTLELLNRCQATLTAKHGPDEDESMAESDYSNIWETKSFEDSQFWFLKTEMAQDAMAALTDASQPEPLEASPVTPLSELVIVTMPSIVVTVEAGVGNKTMPMILLETSFQGFIRDFSSLLHIESSLNVQMWYYNSRLALWEPLIEPVESHHGGQVVHVPWELKMEVEFNDLNAPAGSFEDSTLSTETEIEALQMQPLMNVSISSKENLEITVTKTSLDVISTLGEGFKTAMKDGLPKIGSLSAAPYKVLNFTGLPVELNLGSSSLKLANQLESEEGIATVDLESVELELKEGANRRDALALKSSSGGIVQERVLRISVPEKKANLELPVNRADKRYFSLQQKGDTNPLQWGLVSDVQVEDGGFIVSLRSIIQVHNHFNVGVNVYYMTARGNEVESIGVVEPGKKINLPLKAVYTPTSELFFSVDGHSVSVQPFVWRDLQKTLGMTTLLQCDPKSKEEMEPFFIKAVGEMEQIFYENTSRHTMASTCYNVHLRPAVILKNFLPIDLVCQLQGAADEKPLKAGGRMQIPTAEPGNFTVVLRIPNYLEKEWSCKNPIKANPSEFTVWVFDSYDSTEKVCLDLGVHTVMKNGSMVMAIYAPFWMLNKTGLMLSYRPAEETGNVVYHPANFKGPVLLSYRARDLHSKKKASLKIEDGEWSTNFPLDVAGSSGLVSCKVDGVMYQIGVHIQLNSNSLTKQVTFTPYYILVNNAPFAIECREADRPNDQWIKVEPGACNPFWPKSASNEEGLRVRVAGTTEMSGSFSYSTVYTVLLRLDNKYGGLNVDVQMTEGGVYVSFTAYEPGLAPALVINHTSEIIKIWESGSGYMRKLEARQMVLFAWEKPSGERSLCWSCSKSKELSDSLRKDGIGEFHPHQGVKLYWVSFLDGIQRVLLFTPEAAVARDAQSAGELEVPTMAVSISIHGLGLSLVNSLRQQELVYIGIASSGVIWETRKINGSRFKQLTMADGLLMEEAWERYNRELQIGNSVNPRVKVGKYEVDFEKEEILIPSKRILRRSFQTGLWIQRKVSAHQEQLHVKVNRLQIDNQMADCIFPVVLAPVPPPRSVAATSVLKPYIEMSIVKRLTEHSPVQQYKYYKALVQEFHVKVDIGFLNAILAFFEAEEVSDADEVKTFSYDMRAVEEPLMSHVALQSSAEQKNFYDLLHFSPLKIHVSFSLGDGASSQNLPRVLSVLMQSLGVTLTDMNDVVFKLAYLERQYVFLTQAQLQSEATMHYTGQLLKQLYVLVLGLDVIGNPFGLVVGLTKGVEDLFYEPFQGAIQGPGEFAEGLILGVRSLFGHTVGGAAGAASRITGTIGKGLAALTFDKDYIKKRRENLNKRPANLQTGLAQSGKGLVMGVVDGVTGVFTKPISGAKEEGVEGFFKGVGKGVAGLLTRPTAGIVDFASGSLSAVKRATEMTDEVVRLRPPRYFQPDGLVRPYIRHEAEGNKILQELEKGRYNTTDAYIYHIAMTRSGKEILLLTDKRVAYLKSNDIFGGWQVDWTYTWSAMTEAPKETSDGIHISTGEHKKKAFGLFGGSENGKLVLIPDKVQRQWILKRMIDLHRRST